MGHKAFKYRLYPTKAQETLLKYQLEQCRYVYNRVLELRKENWEKHHLSISCYDTQKLLTIWKKERESLRAVNAQVLQNVCVRVDLAFQSFFRRVKQGDKEPGYPRFKGYLRYDSFTYPSVPSVVKIIGNKVSLSKIGEIKVQLHRQLLGTPKTVTVRRTPTTGKWFVSFSCVDVPTAILPKTGKQCGIDLGLETFAYTSDKKVIKNPRFFRKEEYDLARHQRKIVNLEPKSLEYKKTKKVLARIHERISNKRLDFVHQKARKLVNMYDTIVLEDLNIKGMLGNHCLAKSISDAAWNLFVQVTANKAEEAGRVLVLVDPRGTSQMCSGCGATVTKGLGVRMHTCPSCGLKLPRDLNAAKNILSRGLLKLQKPATSLSLPNKATKVNTNCRAGQLFP